MVTYFNRKDLVSFGTYLMSEKRKANIEAAMQVSMLTGSQEGTTSIRLLDLAEKLKIVHHADIENWLEEQKKED